MPTIAMSAPATAQPATKFEIRDALIREHVGLVHHVARKLAVHLNREADLDELVSAGTIGLLQAVEGFDSSRGLSFSTFAVPRIRGAILDELRKQDRVPRSVRRKSREIGAARERLSATLGRTPTHVEISRELGISGDELLSWETDLERSVHVSLDEPRERGSERTARFSDLLADDAPSAEDRITREQELAHLQAAMADLKDQERTVLALYYFEELKLHEIGEMLGVSACRISQIRTAALAKLRGRMAPLRAA